MRAFRVLLLLGMIWQLSVGCHDESDESKAASKSNSESDSSNVQKIVHLVGKQTGPKVMHDGAPAHIVDMRVRAVLAMEGVKPKGDTWQAGGNWNVHEITYRDGGLKFELAFIAPAKKLKGPVKSKASLRWISGDALPFLVSMAYVFQTKVPGAGQNKGEFVHFDLLVETTSAKDVGTMKMDPEGGDWTVAKATVPGEPSASFRIFLLPTKGLGRIMPLPGESSNVVMGLFAKALL